jgi:hypothetical protein
MNSAEMEYNLSRHPELYHMDVFGVIRLNEEEYEKQTEMKTMIPIGKRDMIIRAKNGKLSSDTEKDKQSLLSTLHAKYPDMNILIEADWDTLDLTDIKAAEDEHTQYVLTNI